MNKGGKLFINGMLNPNVLVVSKFDIKEWMYKDPKMEPELDVLLGVGFKKNKFSCEIRKNFNRDYFTKVSAYESSFSTWSFILGYKLI